MTFDDFKAKHKENVLKGFDDIDGRDYWAEFKADLHTLLADERKLLNLQISEERAQCAKIAEDYCKGIPEDEAHIASRDIARLIRNQTGKRLDESPKPCPICNVVPYCHHRDA